MITQIGCIQCGLILSKHKLEHGQAAYCPRCNAILTRNISNLDDKVLALSIAGLIILAMSLFFPFMSIELKGVTHQIYLMDTVQALATFQYKYIEFLLFTTVILLPLVFMILSFIIFIAIKKNRQNQLHIWLCRVLFAIQPWLMVDVFLIGVLVSFVKIRSLGNVELNTGFFAFFIETFVLVKIVSMIDKENTWRRFESLSMNPGDGGGSFESIVCKRCHAINDSHDAFCWRCHGKLNPLNERLDKPWAFLMTAILLYFPANMLPIMITTSFGKITESTILGGISLLWELESYLVAIIILFASIIIPMAKIFILLVLYIQASCIESVPEKIIRKQAFWFRFTHIIGRWSLIDIFVIALLVALIQLNEVATIEPGPAAISFTCVVLFTILSEKYFDARLFWRSHKNLLRCE